VDVVTVSKRMGHASVDITLRVYAHEVEERRDAADAEVLGALAALTNGANGSAVPGTPAGSR
jgi:integrase